jgi:chromosome segregation ATPase
MKENYKKSRKECKKLEKESQNTPEWQALEAIKEFLEIKEYIPRLLRTKKNIEKKIEAILKQKQTIKEKIQDFAKEEKELLDSLIK